MNQYFEFFRTSEKHPESLSCFSISAGGNFLASSCYNLLNVWDLQDGTLVCSHPHKWTQLHFNLLISSDWNCFITDYDDRIEIRDLLTGCRISDFSIGNRSSIAIHPDGETLIVGGYGHGTSEQPFVPIDLFNLQSGERVRRLKGHDLTPVSSVIVCPDGSKLISQSYHFSVKVWDLETGKELSSFSMPPRRWVDSVAVDLNGNLVVSGCRFESGGLSSSGDWSSFPLDIWNVMTDETLCSFPASLRHGLNAYPPGEPRSMMTPDGTLLVSANSTDVLVWSVESKTCLAELHGHQNKVEHLAISQDGKTVASYAEDGIRAWKQRFH